MVTPAATERLARIVKFDEARALDVLALHVAFDKIKIDVV
jgi:hypothetical protein